MYGTSPSHAHLASHISLHDSAMMNQSHHQLARRNTMFESTVPCSQCKRPIPGNAMGSGLCSNCQAYQRSNHSMALAASQAQMVPYGATSGMPPLPPPPMGSALHMPHPPPFAGSSFAHMGGVRDDLALLPAQRAHMDMGMNMSRGPGGSMMGPMGGMGMGSAMGMNMGMGMGAGVIARPTQPQTKPHPNFNEANTMIRPVLGGGPPMIGNGGTMIPKYPMVTAGVRAGTEYHLAGTRSACERSNASKAPNREMEACGEQGCYHAKGEHPSVIAGAIDGFGGLMKKVYGMVTQNNNLIIEGIDEQERGRRRKVQAKAIRLKKYHTKKQSQLVKKESRNNYTAASREAAITAGNSSRYL
ncbi:hypothetical protein H4R33_006146 [Dimargaris cristalligena]|uniref:Uncharacterized protein n=1 Tax=Dimargaris cristalligena TaxID=215637 RepID=A0A4P9ZRT4_9FUNG|nr:hypothetical protein H4R33_006146 [Dimargaris cristalligena]RKP35362.1 hypothetical protein BJ085DRAFT_39039 [Dimargaris cristalligena]|eukprot:RKP35362.1 hypothetical protein BJ085DRAFT_39039 [Dimargaris cristalligena]